MHAAAAAYLLLLLEGTRSLIHHDIWPPPRHSPWPLRRASPSAGGAAEAPPCSSQPVTATGAKAPAAAAAHVTPAVGGAWPLSHKHTAASPPHLRSLVGVCCSSCSSVITTAALESSQCRPPRPPPPPSDLSSCCCSSSHWCQDTGRCSSLTAALNPSPCVAATTAIAAAAARPLAMAAAADGAATLPLQRLPL